MTQRSRGAALLVVQMVLVLSIAAKYVHERKTCPRVWVRTAQADPSLPLRGRYLALGLTADACALPHYAANLLSPDSTGAWRWRVKAQAKEGRLVAVQVGDDVRPDMTQELSQWGGRPCDRAVLSQPAEYFDWRPREGSVSAEAERGVVGGGDGASEWTAAADSVGDLERGAI